MTSDYVRVAEAADLPPGRLLQVHFEGQVLCLANVDGQVYAVDNRCPHDQRPLAAGRLDGEEIVCPGHGMLFNLPNGTMNACPSDPAAVVRYPVRIAEGGIWVAPAVG